MSDANKRELQARIHAQYGLDGNEAWLRETPPLPKNLMVELSNACNHACIFCQNPVMRRKVGLMDESLLFRVMDEAIAGGVEEIGFYTTGDPFIHKDLAQFTAYAKKIGFTYTYISTNGALATPPRAKAVIDAGMDSIKFSINAGSRETYLKIHRKDEWDLVVANLRFMSDYRKHHAPNMKLFVTSIVTSPIEGELDAMRDLFSPLVDDVVFTPCTPMHHPHPVVTRDAPICTMPFNRLHVSYEGYLKSCCIDYQNYLALVDLRHVSLVDAWRSAIFGAFRRRHLERDLAGTVCGPCWQGDRTPAQPIMSELAAETDFEDYMQEHHENLAGIVPEPK